MRPILRSSKNSTEEMLANLEPFVPIYTPVPGQRPTLTASTGPSVWGWKSWGAGWVRQGQSGSALLLVNIAGHILLCSFGHLSCPPPMSASRCEPFSDTAPLGLSTLRSQAWLSTLLDLHERSKVLEHQDRLRLQQLVFGLQAAFICAVLGRGLWRTIHSAQPSRSSLLSPGSFD